MRKHLQNVAAYIAQKPIRALLIVAYGLSPVIGMVWFEWNVVFVAVLYWAEAVILFVYEVINSLILGPKLRVAKIIAKEVVQIQVLVFTAFQLMFIVGSYEILGEILQTTQSVFDTYAADLAIPVGILAANTILVLVYNARNKEKAVYNNNIVTRWVLVLYIPVLAVITLLEAESSRNLQLGILIAIVTYKIWIELWSDAVERGQEERVVNQHRLEHHPLATYFSILRPFALYPLMIGSLFSAYAPANPSNDLREFLAASFIFVIIGIILYVPRTRVEIDEEESTLKLSFSTWRKSTVEVSLDDITSIQYRTHIRKSVGLSGYLVFVKGRKKPLRIIELYYSPHELYTFMKGLEDRYDISVRLSKEPKFFLSS